MAGPFVFLGAKWVPKIFFVERQNATEPRSACGQTQGLLALIKIIDRDFERRPP